MNDQRSALVAGIEDTVSTLGRAVRQELQRTALGVLTTIATTVIMLVIGIALAIVGVLRLSDALAYACVAWIDDPVLGGAVAGLILVTVPLAGLCIMRRCMRD